jgi:hypothetical protein
MLKNGITAAKCWLVKYFEKTDICAVTVFKDLARGLSNGNDKGRL